MGLSNDLSCEAGSLSCCCPNPQECFQSEALFTLTGALGCAVCFAPRRAQFICVGMWGPGVLPTALPAPLSATLSPALLVSLCTNAGPQGLLVVRLPSPFVPHSASLGPAMAARAVYAPPTGLDECLFCIFLVLDPLAVRFSVSSGCVRRRSVSTYATILVLPPFSFLYNFLSL